MCLWSSWTPLAALACFTVVPCRQWCLFHCLFQIWRMARLTKYLNTWHKCYSAATAEITKQSTNCPAIIISEKLFRLRTNTEFEIKCINCLLWIFPRIQFTYYTQYFLVAQTYVRTWQQILNKCSMINAQRYAINNSIAVE